MIQLNQNSYTYYIKDLFFLIKSQGPKDMKHGGLMDGMSKKIFRKNAQKKH